MGISLQIENRINGHALLSLDESTLRQFGVSYGFKLTLMSIIESLVHDIHLHAYDDVCNVHNYWPEIPYMYRKRASSLTGRDSHYSSSLQQVV